MKCSTVALAILTLLLFAQPALCYKADYGPFAQGASLPLCDLQPLAMQTAGQDPVSARRYSLVDRDRHIDISLFHDSELGYAAELVWGASASERISPFALYGQSNTVVGIYSLYLNDDEYKDFIIMNTVDGAGLGGSFGYVSFILSRATGYEMLQVETWEPNRSEFVVVDGQCNYMQTTFVEGMVSKDGREHNYWLYNLFTFKDEGIASANQLDCRFPKWVMYTWEPNHVETSYLTTIQKRTYEKDVEIFDK